MHLSAIDAPSDKYGAVTDVSRPLLYKLNQASMNRNTHEALSELLVWALAQLMDGVKDSLDAHERHIGLLAPIEVSEEENRPSESLPDAQSQADVGDTTDEGIKSLAAPASITVKDAVPLTLDSLDESVEDNALAAEVAKVEQASTEVPAVTPHKKNIPKP